MKPVESGYYIASPSALTALTLSHRVRSSGERGAVSSDLVTVRYPSGGAQYELSDKRPEVGDVLKRNGDNWVVESVTENKDGATTVTLRPGLKPATGIDETSVNAAPKGP